MVTKESKRKAMSYLVMLLLIAGIFLIINGGTYKWIGVGFFALSVIILLINSIGTYYYSKGSKFLRGSKPDVKKALPYFEKAVQKGIDANSEIVVGTLLIQYGDKEKGRKILEQYISSSDKKLMGASKVSLSMYWWVERDLEKATKLAEEVYESGYRDRNLYVNLLTYYLEGGKYTQFKKLLKESREKGLNAPATLDLEAAYYMTQSDWARCGASLSKLFDITNPAFIDPYLPEALVSLHYGEWENAVKSLRAIKDNVELTNTSVYNEAQIDTLIAYIEDKDTRWGFREAVENDPTVLIKRSLPEVRRGVEMPECPQKPDFANVEPPMDELTDKDEGDVDTSLTADDEEWLKRHAND